jgi:serine/threonine protein kinase
MPYYKHGSLKNWITTTDPDDPTRRSVLRQTLLAISFVHSRGKAHCDLKGENVLITDEGTPKLCDFELSRYVTHSRVPISRCRVLTR